MTREEAIAAAKRRQASDPDASWIATSRDGEWMVVRIGVAPPELSHLRRRRTNQRVGGRPVSAQAFREGCHSVACKPIPSRWADTTSEPSRRGPDSHET
jgi:hypothetical protein